MISAAYQTSLLLCSRARTGVGVACRAAHRREFGIDAVTVEALRSHLARQAADKLAWGPGWVDSGYVFTDERGEPIHPNELSAEFKKAAKGARLPEIRFHDLRHSARGSPCRRAYPSRS